MVQVGLCGLAEMGMTETITLSDKPRKLPFNLNTYFGLESYGITKEAVQAAKNPEKVSLFFSRALDKREYLVIIRDNFY